MGGNLPTPDPAPVGRQPALRRLPVQVAAAQRALPRNVRALSWVSFANDAASELAYPVVPLFLTVTLGAPVGYHRALDTAGAVVGPLTAVVLLAVGLSFRNVLWVAVVPGFLTLVLLRAVREAPRQERKDAMARAAEPGPLPHAFWMALGIWVVFSLGNSSDVFLLLRAKDLGLGATLVVLAYSAYNLVYASLSWPLGALSDRGRERILAAGLVVFALVYLGFAIAPGSWAVWPLFALYGVYIAATDGVARAWVADRVPGRAIGTAYGVFSAATGAALLAASIAAGLLWSHVSPAAPFVVGAAAAALAFLLLVLSSPMRAQAARPRDAQPQP